MKPTKPHLYEPEFDGCIADLPSRDAREVAHAIEQSVSSFLNYFPDEQSDFDCLERIEQKRRRAAKLIEGVLQGRRFRPPVFAASDRVEFVGEALGAVLMIQLGALGRDLDAEWTKRRITKFIQVMEDASISTNKYKTNINEVLFVSEEKGHIINEKIFEVRIVGMKAVCSMSEENRKVLVYSIVAPDRATIQKQWALLIS